MSNSVVVKTALVNPPVNKQGSDATQLAPYRLNPCLKTGFEGAGGLAV